MISTIVSVIASLCALGYAYSPGVAHLKNDFKIRTKVNGTHHRLSAWVELGPNQVKCDMTRPNIKTFGYCWKDENEARGINTDQERGWVREALQQWEKCGGITFVEESMCRSGPDFVTVNIANFAPITNEDIDVPTCTIHGFNIYMSFYTFGANIESYRTTEKVRKSNIQMYAIHEFGHFLGFDHEHNRDDRNDGLNKCIYEVDKSEVGPDAIYANKKITTEYDVDSIMNYCRPNVHFKPWLSDIDRRGVWQVYGGGNWDECLAATKPWAWYAGEGLDDTTLLELNMEAQGITCYNRLTDNQCQSYGTTICSTGGTMRTYYCPKMCNYCQ